jgi:hypothetical protein
LICIQIVDVLDGGGLTALGGCQAAREAAVVAKSDLAIDEQNRANQHAASWPRCCATRETGAKWPYFEEVDSDFVGRGGQIGGPARRSPYIRWNRGPLDPPGAGHNGIPSMSLLTTPIESIRQTRSNFGLVALTLLGILAIALALSLPDSITP